MTEQTQPIVERDPVYERRFSGQSWLARCPSCRKIISRYDFDEDSARRCGLEALSTDHNCRPEEKR